MKIFDANIEEKLIVNSGGNDNVGCPACKNEYVKILVKAVMPVTKTV